MIRASIILTILPFALCGCDETPYPASFGIFYGSPGWDLAKAARANDTTKIGKLVEGGADVNYQEPVYGYTVLMTALCNLRDPLRPVKISTIRALVKSGADPNLYSNSRYGLNAVLIACDENNSEALEILLEHGGDPNSSCRRGDDFVKDNTLTAIARTLNHPEDVRALKMLIDAGADLDAKTENCGPAVSIYVEVHKYKQLLLLLEGGASYDGYYTDFFDYDSLGNCKRKPILSFLREAIIPLDSENYMYKRKVIEFLKKRGLDYDTVPIPESVVRWAKQKYPDSWEHYLEVY